MKKCTHCKQEKPFTEYYPVGNGIGGMRPRCKECMKFLEKKKYGENADFRWSKLSKQGIKLKTDPEHKARHQQSQRRWHLKTSYGLTLEMFNAMVSSQGGGCAICGTKPEDGNPKTRMVVDHCHKTNTVRGILCDLCNTAIGKFHDDVSKLESAIRYLKNDRP